MPTLNRDGDVFVLNLGEGENRFNPDSVGALNTLIDEVECAEAPRALVLAADGKIWSNGLDLEWFAANLDSVNDFLAEMHGLFARVLKMGVPTVAALQGHTFAAGAMLALACDIRVMRADRGFFCMPEVDIRIPFTPGMSSLIQARLAPQTAHEVMTTGRRFGGEEALAAGIVQQVASADELPAVALANATALAGKDPVTLATIKQRMYGPTLAALADNAANSMPGLGS